MKKEIKINLNAEELFDLRYLLVEEVSRLLDKIEEYRRLGNHSDANRLHSKAEKMNNLHEELCRLYNENFED